MPKHGYPTYFSTRSHAPLAVTLRSPSALSMSARSTTKPRTHSSSNSQRTQAGSLTATSWSRRWRANVGLRIQHNGLAVTGDWTGRVRRWKPGVDDAPVLGLRFSHHHRPGSCRF